MDSWVDLISHESRELVADHEVFVGNVSQRRASPEPLAIEVFDIAVNVLLAPMKLPVETALSVGYWRDIIDYRLPVHRFSPQERIHPDVEVSPRVIENLHHRSAVIEDAVY